MTNFLKATAVVLTLFIAPIALAHDGGAMKVAATFFHSGKWQIEVTIDSEHIPAEINPLKDPKNRDTRVGEFARSFLTHSTLAFDGSPSELNLESAPVLDSPTAAGSDRVHLQLFGTTPSSARHVTWSHDLILSEYFLQLTNEGETEPVGQWLEKGRTSKPFDLSLAAPHQPTSGVIGTYLKLGFTHIIPDGADHILFVLGLFLLGGGMKPLLMQVSAFTVAHTITLGLTMCGVISLPASIVEPAIAISIVFVAVENIFMKKCGWRRTVVVFVFGLLHGMGFAGVLSELGLPAGQFVPALLSFNAGVELGQLSVIAAAYCIVGIAFSAKPYYHARIAVPASLGIALVGAYWAVERIAG